MIAYGAITLYGAAFQQTFATQRGSNGARTTSTRPHGLCSVCAVPPLLAATKGISVDFSSCGY